MSRLCVTRCCMADCMFVAENISAPDRDEIEAVGKTPIDALRECYVRSFRAWTVTDGSFPVFVFGLAHEDWQWTAPWAFSTPAVSAHAFEFARGSVRVARKFFSEYPCMRNYVDARHKVSIHWLRSMGFSVDSPVPYGPLGSEFCLFWHRR